VSQEQAVTGSGLTGAATGGYITLSGPVLTVRVRSTEFDDWDKKYQTWCYGPSGGLLRLLWMPDADELVDLAKPN